MKTYKNIDDYIADQENDKKAVLQQFRQIIKSAAPHSEEVISYGMPAFKQQNVLVYFASYKDHYGLYPTSKPIEIFKDKLTQYKTSKGAIQFPANQPIPKKLIIEIVKYRVKDNLGKMQLKDLIGKKSPAKKSGKK